MRESRRVVRVQSGEEEDEEEKGLQLTDIPGGVSRALARG